MNKNNKNIKPIFIFSLHRTGSTLLQRILMGHSKIVSIAEPHFLLPFVFSYKKEGTFTKYSHFNSYKGLRDLIFNLKNGEEDFNKLLNDFSINIYNSFAERGEIYFLDKTPRYFWIIPEIAKIFPNAKFIFLFRNPVQIYASTLTTFSDNRFNNLQGYYVNMNEGNELLSNGYNNLRSKSFKIKYEDFVSNTEEVLQELLKYLELEYEEDMLLSFEKQSIKGKSKDPTGINMYKKVKKLPLEKWKKIFNTSYRKFIIKKYIENLNEEVLLIQGYDKKKILDDIDNLILDGSYSFIQDFIDFNKLKISLRFKLNLFFGKNSKWARKYYLN